MISLFKDHGEVISCDELASATGYSSRHVRAVVKRAFPHKTYKGSKTQLTAEEFETVLKLLPRASYTKTPENSFEVEKVDIITSKGGENNQLLMSSSRYSIKQVEEIAHLVTRSWKEGYKAGLKDGGQA